MAATIQFDVPNNNNSDAPSTDPVHPHGAFEIVFHSPKQRGSEHSGGHHPPCWNGMTNDDISRQIGAPAAEGFGVVETQQEPSGISVQP